MDETHATRNEFRPGFLLGVQGMLCMWSLGLFWWRYEAILYPLGASFFAANILMAFWLKNRGNMTPACTHYMWVLPLLPLIVFWGCVGMVIIVYLIRAFYQYIGAEWKEEDGPLFIQRPHAKVAMWLWYALLVVNAVSVVNQAPMCLFIYHLLLHAMCSGMFVWVIVGQTSFVPYLIMSIPCFISTYLIRTYKEPEEVNVVEVKKDVMKDGYEELA